MPKTEDQKTSLAAIAITLFDIEDDIAWDSVRPAWQYKLKSWRTQLVDISRVKQAGAEELANLHALSVMFQSHVKANHFAPWFDQSRWRARLQAADDVPSFAEVVACLRSALSAGEAPTWMGDTTARPGAATPLQLSAVKVEEEVQVKMETQVHASSERGSSSRAAAGKRRLASGNSGIVPEEPASRASGKRRAEVPLLSAAFSLNSSDKARAEGRKGKGTATDEGLLLPSAVFWDVVVKAEVEEAMEVEEEEVEEEEEEEEGEDEEEEGGEEEVEMEGGEEAEEEEADFVDGQGRHLRHRHRTARLGANDDDDDDEGEEDDDDDDDHDGDDDDDEAWSGEDEDAEQDAEEDDSDSDESWDEDEDVDEETLESKAARSATRRGRGSASRRGGYESEEGSDEEDEEGSSAPVAAVLSASWLQESSNNPSTMTFAPCTPHPAPGTLAPAALHLAFCLGLCSTYPCGSYLDQLMQDGAEDDEDDGSSAQGTSGQMASFDSSLLATALAASVDERKVRCWPPA